MTPLPDQPAEIHLAATRLLAGHDCVPWRHARTWRHQPDPYERRYAQPVGSIESSCWEDHRYLAQGVCQGVCCKIWSNIERWITNDIIDIVEIGTEKIET